MRQRTGRFGWSRLVMRQFFGGEAWSFFLARAPESGREADREGSFNEL
jgi:hypothetical protein